MSGSRRKLREEGQVLCLSAQLRQSRTLLADDVLCAAIVYAIFNAVGSTGTAALPLEVLRPPRDDAALCMA